MQFMLYLLWGSSLQLNGAWHGNVRYSLRANSGVSLPLFIQQGSHDTLALSVPHRAGSNATSCEPAPLTPLR
jgi:hypothetical protein